MVKFLKLNGLSTLYGLHFAIQIELLMNTYRLARVTEMDLAKANTMIGWTVLLIWIATSFLMYGLTKVLLGSRKIKFWTSVLWIPYAAAVIYAFGSLFPITDRGEMPSPVMGLILIGAAFLYPFYIILINMLSFIRSEDVPKSG
ncbi:hypothetical protein [Paenibacillus aceti]|uniref:Uncharacterized protein n=1 Tax=Paenibacillus aceti TaxID=1820010 RepID=A0ABQ1VTY5_9BACL|nr:hypothetical protein [Paenibacillus aceti]GGF99126.1 hypothetical protein GCM10010913_21140 [Paenibacillus aceti]